MALQQRLDLRQTQSLTMTPQLQQAIKLLQLGHMELTAFIEQELERNPFLDVEDSSENDRDAEPAEMRRDADSSLFDPVEAGQSEAPLDVEIDNTWDEGSPFEGPSYDPDAFSPDAFSPDAFSWSASGFAHGLQGGEGPDLEATLTQTPTLRQHLSAQLELEFSDPSDRLIGTALIDALDDAGRLSVDCASLAETLGLPTARAQAVLERMQGFDPTGIFARDLAECLALQLKERDRYDPAMAALVGRLDLLARRDLDALRKICGVDDDDLRAMIAEIRRLDPKPGQRFETAGAGPVVPDVLMRPAFDGGWIVELNPETLPRLLINNRYYAAIDKSALRKEEKAFLSESYQNAHWLKKSLDQRAQTILKVSSEIVQRQHEFFEHGISRLKPLILRDIALALAMHESTVSRVTAHKYIATPRGTFELKYFFSQAIASARNDGEAHAAESVRHRIRALIEAEPATAVLSDDALVERLRAEGIEIARRTVAKYRETLRIPSSAQRRRDKSLRFQSVNQT